MSTATVSLQERFERFHADNPHVYRYFVDFLRQRKAEGYTRYGLNVVLALMRWQPVATVTAEAFKINQNFISRYARLIMDQEPDLRGFLEVRKLRS